MGATCRLIDLTGGPMERARRPHRVRDIATKPVSAALRLPTAPGGVSGLIQINAKIPPGVGTGPQQVFFTVGGVPSQGNVTVNVR